VLFGEFRQPLRIGRLRGYGVVELGHVGVGTHPHHVRRDGEVFGRGHWYGTLLSEVRPSPNDKKWVILDIDVDGAQKVRSQLPGVPTIFLRPSSDEELERRLRARGTESEPAIQRRLEVARRELARADQYQFQVVNDTIERAVDEISKILEKLGAVT
jgi:guanylate kinase